MDKNFKDIKQRLIKYHVDKNHNNIVEILVNTESINELERIYLATDDYDYYKTYKLIPAWSLEELSLKLAILGY